MKSAGKIIIIVLVAGLAAFGCVGGCAYKGYARVISLDEQVKVAWAQVEDKLQRRYDLIPNAVATVKGLAAQEEKVFIGVAEARKAYTGAQTVSDKARAANAVESALSRLLVIQERYPELRSNEAFLKLQDQLEGSENRLSVERGRYNEAVGKLNSYIRKPWGRMMSSLADVEQAEYFKVAEEAKAVPTVDFTEEGEEG